MVPTYGRFNIFFHSIFATYYSHHDCIIIPAQVFHNPCASGEPQASNSGRQSCAYDSEKQNSLSEIGVAGRRWCRWIIHGLDPLIYPVEKESRNGSDKKR